ncbi:MULTISPECIES: hypothetical protein [Sorangium]|uniref:hypothetical protein n=1 Tax=Sorangium TaxID=39643 RepID=UPI003D9C20E0
MSLFARAIPQVEPPIVGVHLLWSGPHAWLYSPAGWTIQRRQGAPRPRWDCVSLTADQLAALRARRELRIRLGVLTDRVGAAPAPLLAAAGSLAAAGAAVAGAAVAASAAGAAPWEVITVELDSPSDGVRIPVQATASLAVALRDGKVVAGGRAVAGNTAHELVAAGIDTVVVHARGLTALGVCVSLAREDDWRDAATIARLQLPLRELDPELTSADDEYDAAKRRLLPGETLDRGELEHLTGILRKVVAAVGPPRPIDMTLLLRDDPELRHDELVALDPLRAVIAHPRWRRVLGFAHFDADPALVPGQVYQYRVSGGWPEADLTDRVVGFHTAPATTQLPAELSLGDVRVRFSRPRLVELADPRPSDPIALTRRGVALSPRREPGWLTPGTDGWSAVIDLPVAVTSLVLELGHAAHSLTFAAGAPWLPQGPEASVPAGDRPALSFATPVHQIRLGGEGFLCALRFPAKSETAIVERAVVLPPLVLADTPRPAAPLAAWITNLQQPESVATGDAPVGPPPPRHALGFEVRWIPAPTEGIDAWPAELPPPPIDAALFQIEHTPAGGAPSWTPLLDEDNHVTGHRDDVALPPMTVGGDLMASFPEVLSPAPGGLTLSWRDVFDFPDGGAPVRRPRPEPGTRHRYRVRAVDAVGRAGAVWCETGELRLEKRRPPPLPAGPDEAKADALALPAPTGVHARVLVAGAPDLTDGERAILGGHGSAILLRWGWHAAQRAEDPYATEFRVYATRRRLDAIPGVLSAVSGSGGLYLATLTLGEPVLANAARRLRLDAGYPFEILAHDGGAAGAPLSITLRAQVPLPGGAFPVPRAGAVVLPVHLTPDRTTAPAWGARVEVRAIGPDAAYESAPIFDLLDLRADHPHDRALVGVSAADAQDYVPDRLAPGDARPGNESAIAGVEVEGRWQGRPALVEAPALADVPAVVTPEPGDRPMRLVLDVTPLLAGAGLSGGERARPERCSADDVFRAYSARDGRVLARVLEPPAPGDAEVEVAVPNASDRAAIVAALDGHDVGALTDRHAVFLAAAHPYRARLFTPVTQEPVTLPRFAETLPNRGARWIYRVRLADAAGRLSADGRTLRGVVRVPATTRVPPPRREAAQPGDPRARLRLRVEGPGEITHLLLFQRVDPVDLGRAPSGDEAELLRVPGAAHLPPGAGVRLRLGGEILAPQVKSLSDPGVAGAPPSRRVVLDLALVDGQRARVWAVSVTRDGVASAPEAWAIAMPRAALSAPALSVSSSPPELLFTWTWPSPADATEVVLEAAPADRDAWSRVSGRIARDVAAHAHRPAPGVFRYRLRALSLDGRDALSAEVTPS